MEEKEPDGVEQSQFDKFKAAARQLETDGEPDWREQGRAIEYWLAAAFVALAPIIGLICGAYWLLRKGAG